MSKIARIFVNRIEVGTVPADLYEKIVKQAKRDWKLYVSQGFNLVAVAFRFFVDTLRLTPWLWFITSAGLAVLAPDILGDVFAALSKATPAELANEYRKAVMYGPLGVSAMLLAGMAGGFGSKYGFVDRFGEVVGERLRALLEVPAEGSIDVFIVDDEAKAGQASPAEVAAALKLRSMSSLSDE